MTNPANQSPEPHNPPEHTVPDELKQRLATLDEAVTLPPVAKRNWTPWVVGLLLLSVAGGAGYWGYQRYSQPEGPPKNLETQPLTRGDITLTLIEKGELEAARNTEIICQVRASGRGSQAASSIKWVIDDGTRVKKGDLLVQLEDASIREQLNNQYIVVEEKNDLYEQAKANLKIVENENKAAELTAWSNYEIAKIDLEKFLKAEKQQKQFDIDSRIKLANADLMQWRDKLGWSNRMFIRGYLSANQKLNDETRLDKAAVDLDKLSKEYDTLTYDNKRMELDLINKMEQAKLALEIAKENSESKRAQAQAKLTSADLILKQETQKKSDYEQDLRNCRITAPHDGMVIYFVPESSRFGGSSQTSTIEVGAPVKEGQKLMRIPNLSRMIARVKVNESFVSRIRGDVTAPTGFTASYDAGYAIAQWGHLISAHAVPGHHAALPLYLPGIIAQKEIKADLAHLDEEVVEDGMPASIKVAGSERVLAGHVKSVAAVASSTDWMSSDVKVYQTVVTIDDYVDFLKPSMSAEVTVKIDERKDVLRLPVQAVLESGGKKFCYVKDLTGVTKKYVRTGLNDYKFVEILPDSEVKENEQVVLNARAYAEKVNDLQGNVNIDMGSMMRERGNRKGGPPGKGGPEAPEKGNWQGGPPRAAGQPGRNTPFNQSTPRRSASLAAKQMEETDTKAGEPLTPRKSSSGDRSAPGASN
ncbi:MAG TPA: hypothetical protein PKD72_03160 [Gemmatales bacterium]|nr:hypothetical protein [Gemmatales bacterium]